MTYEETRPSGRRDDPGDVDDVDVSDLTDDFTDDLTVDGADLFEELRAAHHLDNAEQNGPATLTGDAHGAGHAAGHGDRAGDHAGDADDLTIDGAALLEELKGDVEGNGVPATVGTTSPQTPSTDAANPARFVSGDISEATLPRWAPAPMLPATDEVVEPRAGKANSVQRLVIVGVVALSLLLGAIVLRSALSTPEDEREAPVGDIEPSRYIQGFGQ